MLTGCQRLLGEGNIPFCCGRFYERSKLLLRPASQNTQFLGTATPTFRKQGSTRIINYSSASGSDTAAVTYEGKHETPTTVEESKDTV